MTPTELTLTVGETEKITATVKPSNATNKKVNWTTSDADVATVDENGEVKAVAVGTATVTATSAADSTKKASCEVTVIAEEPVEPTPIQATLVSTGNVGIAPDTAGEAAGNIYAEYKLVANEKDISLASDNVEYIKVKVGEGEWQELTANTDATLWFNVEKATGTYKYEVKITDGNVYTATLNWDKEIKTATWEATDREGEHDGKTYVEYKLMDSEDQVSLKIGEVKLIASEKEGKWVALEPNTDSTLWFNKAKDTGNYNFFVVTSEGTMYKATLAYTAPATEANFEATGNVGIAPDTAGEAAGNIYAEYKLVANEKDISLTSDNVEYIKVKVGEGEWQDLTANTDATLWFNVEAETGLRTFEVKTKDEKVYTATLDWDKAIKTATWDATGGEGLHDGKTYVEYKMMDGTDPVSLKVGEVKLIASKDDGKWVALEPNTDATLWFNKAKATGNYDFFVVASEGAMYKATLAYTAPTELDSTIAKDAGTGGTGTTAIVDGKTITFSGNIDWYPADDTLGRTEGNRVGVKITAPITVTLGEATTLTFNQTTGEDKTITGWENFSDGDNYFYFYPLVKEAGQTTTLVIKWDGTDATADTFTIKIAEGTTLEAAPVEPIAATVDYNAVWNETRGTWYIKVSVPEESLDVDSVTSINAIKEAGIELTEPRTLTPDTDKVLWFGVAKGDGDTSLKTEGEYAYEVVRKDGTKYIFNFTYAPGSVTGVSNLVQAALDAVNSASNADNYAAVKTALEENAAKLGLDLTEYEKLTPVGRQNAVANDIFNNKPEGGYTIETLKPMFDEIVATRMVFQESVAIFAAASTENPLTDLSYITMLQENLNAVTLQKVHSGRDIKEDILPKLDGLVTDFGNLTTEQQTAVLKTIDYSKSTSSTATRNALRAAIDKVVADEKA